MRELIRTEVAYVRSLVLRLGRKRRLSFIQIHYLYILAMGFLGSILLYPAGGIAYIDSLFFAMGAATQSGLNTVDVNKLLLYQQVILYLVPMFTNPITINSAVVFVRLYWFEKRFQHVVKEAMSWRRTKSKGRPDTQMIDEREEKLKEGGVNGRSIRVLDDGQPVGPGGSRIPFKERQKQSPIMESSSSSDTQSPKKQGPPEPLAPFRREITFADDVGSPFSPPARLPEQRPPEQHIAFVENQRNPKDKDILRIPGPREYDQGHGPETVQDEDDALSKQVTNSVNQDSGHADGDELKPEDRTKKNITFDSSTRPGLSPIESHRSTVHFRSLPTNGSRQQTPGPYTPATPGFSRGLSTPKPRPRTGTFSSLMRSGTQPQTPMPYLSWQPTIGRNSAFIDLTEEQREELGGIEYRSLKTLVVILLFYFFFFHLLGIVTLTPWIILTDTWGKIVNDDGIGRPWWGIFSAATLFNDLGFTLTPDSFVSFQSAVFPMLMGSFLIVIGNTGFPCLLRLMIWMASKVVRPSSAVWEEIRFLLDHPRRCFTLLFPSHATWVLFAILILLNGIDLIFFIILDLNDETVTSIPAGSRVLAGLFQAASTRTAGTSAVNLANLHPGIQVSYLIMMYISVFPIAISMRRTNVYEERSLGIYGSTGEEDDDPKEPSYIGTHLRKQLSFDLWFIFLGLFIIAIAEGNRLQNPAETSFTLFACLFEIVSAYGTVGLSLGYPNINASFSAEFTTVSKLVIIAMMWRGRHRGLPYQLDRAILLPSENLHRKEDADASMRARRASLLSNNEGLMPFPSARSFRDDRTTRSFRNDDLAQTEVQQFPRYDTRDSVQHVQSAPATATGVESPLQSPAHHHDLDSASHPRRGIGRVIAGMASMNDMIRSHTTHSRSDTEKNLDKDA